jgi:type II secretory pathway pseudopilin PulG
MRNGRLSARRHGFTYLSLIILVAIIGLVSAASIKLGSVLQRSAAERELLAIGAEYADALESYAKATPPGQSPLPPSFKELLRDPRFPGVRRHLRRIYVDPMTGSSEWGIVYANNAQVGYASNAPGQQGSAAGPGAGMPGAPAGATSAALSATRPGARPGSQAGTPSALSAALNPQGGADGAGEAGVAVSTSTPQPLKAGGTSGILAIYSLSNAQPVKIGNFPMRFQGFDNRKHISDWKFTRPQAPLGATPPPVRQPQPGQPQQPVQQEQAPGQPPQEPPAEPAQPAAPPPDVPSEPQPEPEAPPQRGGDEPPAEGQEAPPAPDHPAKTDS